MSEQTSEHQLQRRFSAKLRHALDDLGLPTNRNARIQSLFQITKIAPELCAELIHGNLWPTPEMLETLTQATNRPASYFFTAEDDGIPEDTLFAYPRTPGERLILRLPPEFNQRVAKLLGSEKFPTQYRRATKDLGHGVEKDDLLVYTASDPGCCQIHVGAFYVVRSQRMLMLTECVSITNQIALLTPDSTQMLPTLTIPLGADGQMESGHASGISIGLLLATVKPAQSLMDRATAARKVVSAKKNHSPKGVVVPETAAASKTATVVSLNAVRDTVRG